MLLLLHGTMSRYRGEFYIYLRHKGSRKGECYCSLSAHIGRWREKCSCAFLWILGDFHFHHHYSLAWEEWGMSLLRSWKNIWTSCENIKLKIWYWQQLIATLLPYHPAHGYGEWSSEGSFAAYGRNGSSSFFQFSCALWICESFQMTMLSMVSWIVDDPIWIEQIMSRQHKSTKAIESKNYLTAGSNDAKSPRML